MISRCNLIYTNARNIARSNLALSFMIPNNKCYHAVHLHQDRVYYLQLVYIDTVRYLVLKYCDFYNLLVR